jgi:DNA-binding NtrC family response regulator
LESVQGGTVFLDEVGTLDVDLQAKLLRVLQERKLRRLGGQETIDIDIRLISATNDDLEQAIAEGRFRRDLYYRLQVFTIALPPLRDRSGDVPLLAEHFLGELNQQGDKTVAGISMEALSLMDLYPWPGNIRELQNTVEYAFRLTDSGRITPASLPLTITGPAPHNDGPGDGGGATLEDARDRFERTYLADILSRCAGNVSRAALAAGTHRTTMQRMMRKHGIRSDRYRSD